MTTGCLARWLWPAAWIVAAGVGPVGGGCVRSTPVRLRAVNPRYLELYSLSKSADGTHTIAVVAPHDETWYRESVPALDLDDCKFADAFAGRDSHGEYCVNLWVKERSYAKLSSWSRAHMGQHAGFMLGGKLVSVNRIGSELETSVSVGPFGDRTELSAVLASIKAGGAGTSPTTTRSVSE